VERGIHEQPAHHDPSFVEIAARNLLQNGYAADQVGWVGVNLEAQSSDFGNADYFFDCAAREVRRPGEVNGTADFDASIKRCVVQGRAVGEGDVVEFRHYHFGIGGEPGDECGCGGFHTW